MFNKKFLKLIAKMMNSLSGLHAFLDDRKILKKIKQAVVHDVLEDKFNSIAWRDESIEGMYVQVHKRYFTKRGFEVALVDGYVTISW